MRIADQNVPVTGDVDSVWEAGNLFASDPAHKLAVLVKYNDAVSLFMFNQAVLS